LKKSWPRQAPACGGSTDADAAIIGFMVHSPGFLAIVNEAKTRVKQVDIAGYKRMVAAGEPHLLIDVREESEWAAGHARSAIHIGKGVIERDIEKKVPGKETKLVLYCGGGYRSALAADALGRMGYSDVISLDGGWRAFKESGLPTE
jgi:rhodanese-related sulfurtransferase